MGADRDESAAAYAAWSRVCQQGPLTLDGYPGDRVGLSLSGKGLWPRIGVDGAILVGVAGVPFGQRGHGSR